MSKQKNPTYGPDPKNSGVSGMIPLDFQMLLIWLWISDIIKSCTSWLSYSVHCVVLFLKPWRNLFTHSLSQRDVIRPKDWLLPEIAQLLHSVDTGASYILTCDAGNATSSGIEMAVFETTYGSYSSNGFLKPLKILLHNGCELEKMFSLTDSLPAVEHHSMSYSVHCVVLFLKPICFCGGKCFLIAVHLSIEKHFFWCSAKSIFPSFFLSPH